MASISGGSMGQCTMRGQCGKKSPYTAKELPCPYDGPPENPEDDTARDLLVSVCGAKFADGPVCCTLEQMESMKENFNIVETLVSSCPACRNNFRNFFCSFTCSPNQAEFLNVTSTQTTVEGLTAVESIDFFVSEEYGTGFYDSCKNVQVGAANLYAMDLIGGGAKDYHAFFKFLGDVKPNGSPFQIAFPSSSPAEISPFNDSSRHCADRDLGSRCTCIDCPEVCQELPFIPPPGAAPRCHMGDLSCLSFILIVGYSLAILAFLVGFALQTFVKRRKENGIVIDGPETALDTPMSPRLNSHGLIGASSLAQPHSGEGSLGTPTESRHLGRGASLLDPMETVQPRQYPLNTLLRRYCYRWGLLMANKPWLTFAAVFAFIGLLNLGWKRFEVEIDPVRLWVAPDSDSKIQKEFFDQHFGPFFRTEQVIVTASPTAAQSMALINSTALDIGLAKDKGPVLSWEHLKYWFGIEEEIRELQSPNGYTHDDVCYRPAGPTGPCVVQSVAAWFGNDIDSTDSEKWAEQILLCANSPVECLPDYQLPLAPEYVLGGVPTKSDGSREYLNARAMVLTIVVANSLDVEKVEKAAEWERTLRAYLEDLAARIPAEAGLEIAFNTEVSIQEEINKSTNTDVKIVVLSYVAMFFYVALTLGSGSGGQEEGLYPSLKRWAINFPKLFKQSTATSSSITDDDDIPTFFPRLPRKLFVGSKFTLGLFGILLVILSVSSSIGFFSGIGVKVTLIIAEVIPFLVLAIGVDNVFILVHELDRQNMLHGPNATGLGNGQNSSVTSTLSPQRGRTTFDSSHDDSIEAVSMPLFFSAEERVARALAKMGPSILLSTVTEMTAFALGALVPMPAVRNFALYAAGSVLLNAMLQVTVFISALALDLRRVEASRVDCLPCVTLPSRIVLQDTRSAGGGLGGIAKFLRRHYAPFILRPMVKTSVLAFFGGLFVTSVVSIQRINLGLDQRLALPSDSYLINYFDNLYAYLDIGPPVYFVTYGADVTQREPQQRLCGRFSTCDDFSIANVLEAERKRPESSFISQPSASWVDDYFNWLNPLQESCCRVKKRDPDTFCTPRDRERLCRPCLAEREPAWNVTMNGLPEGKEFMHYLQQWLVSPTDSDCPLAGASSFGQALSISQDKETVDASHFRTYHTPLKSQDDFINAFSAAHRIADDLAQRTKMKVFPYSVFYVFFDQYAHIIAITQEILGLGLAAVLLVTALLLGSWRTGTIVTGVVALTVTTCMGVMGIWGISLNAISLVNLVISLGIAVEFCAHIARAFMSAGSGLPVDHPAGQKERDERMYTALVDVGPSVLSGITFTKLIGISVLALTRSRLLEIYYFRMWFTLIISGALHGLVLLPVVLSLAGGPGYPFQEADEEWMSNAIRDDYEYAPFLADDNSVDSN